MRSCAKRMSLLVLGVLLVAWANASVAESVAPARAIRVAVYADGGASKKDNPHLVRCLPAEAGFELEKLTAEEIRSGRLADFDVLIQPGGSASKQAKTLGDEGQKAVRDFVDQGGGFVGICAGAYLASANYSWSLGLLDAQVVDSEHWARGFGEVQLKLTSAGQEAFDLADGTCAIYYHQGPLLAPGEKEEIEDYEMLAAFETEIAENGAPKGVMKGTTAIARGSYGAGRVICFSPHPEKTTGRDDFVRAAVRWAADE